MYQTIILDCQTIKGTLNCVDCIAYKECTIRKNIKKQGQLKVTKEINALPLKEKTENLVCCVQI
jgi:hypothetical protein